jgi:hypothetical protein
MATKFGEFIRGLKAATKKNSTYTDRNGVVHTRSDFERGRAAGKVDQINYSITKYKEQQGNTAGSSQRNNNAYKGQRKTGGKR